MSLKPLFARVLLRREKLKSSSIILPTDAARKNAKFKGEVIAAGPTCSDDIKALVGKTVVFGIYAGTWINEDGTVAAKEGESDYFVCSDEDLIAVVE